MNIIAHPSELRTHIVNILNGEPCTLFAGAGISAFAGMRVWQDYLSELANALETYEPGLAGVMRTRIGRGLLLEAAHSFFDSTDMPIGDKYQNLVSKLQTPQYDPLKLLPLVALPFEAIVTTNYDRALLEAWARHHHDAPYCVERNDPTMKAAPFNSAFFIARIHGRVEVPTQMVLETRHYEELDNDAVYQDFLHSIFMRRKCLFIGFSFLDPAINNVLATLKKRGHFPKKHYAVVPAGAEQLIARLAAENIQVLLYDPINGHEVLWKAIDETGKGIFKSDTDPTTRRLSAFETARRLLAICYTHSHMGSDVVALRQIVVEGIVISLLSSGAKSVGELRDRLPEFLAVNDVEADLLLEDAINDLELKHMCFREMGVITLVIKLPDSQEMKPIQILVAGTTHRLMVREQYELKADAVAKLSSIIEEAIVLRGWDLGAEFAGAHIEEEISPLLTIQGAVRRHVPQLDRARQQQLADAIVDLMRRPNSKEESALGELGRLAFGIEVILQAGRATMYSTTFPDTVYLDASVLMPAITSGHPYREAYMDAIHTVQKMVGAASEVYVADVFLEEIYSHRNNAAELVQELGLDKKERLKAFISYFSPTNTNVFIGAYSTHIATEKHTDSFATFLGKIAPYRNEKELIRYLQQSGIKIAWTKGRPEKEEKRYADIRTALLESYDVAEAEKRENQKKKPVLKQHEAAQLALLEQALAGGRRAVFVTADNKLRRAVEASPKLRKLSDSLISHLGLVQLVDLLVGLNIDPSSLRRLLWSVHVADARTSVKDYLIMRALEQYDAALLYRMGELLDDFAQKYAREAEMEDVQLTGNIKGAMQSKTRRFLDRVDNELFEFMATEIKKEKMKAANKKS